MTIEIIDEHTTVVVQDAAPPTIIESYQGPPGDLVVIGDVPVLSVFGRLNHVAAQSTDYAAHYAALFHQHTEYAPNNHNHDDRYSLITHNHDGRYSLISHLHDDRYSLLDHNHSGVYAPLNHLHDDRYSLLGHNHDTRYSLLGHNHDAEYSPLGHTHVEADITNLDKYTQSEIDVFNQALFNLIVQHANDYLNPHQVDYVQVGADQLGSAQAVQDNLNTHTTDTANPHSVTKAQVGLGNVDNTSDLSKPVSTAQQSALDLKQDLSQRAQADGYASLGPDGKVPSSQLPSGSGSLQGQWDANANNPNLAAGAPYNNGDYWIVSTAGSTDLNGITSWNVGDWALWSSSEPGNWVRVEIGNTVASVFGRVGNITAQVADYSTFYAASIHPHIEGDIVDLDKYTQAEVDAAFDVLQGNIDSHAQSVSNPHNTNWTNLQGKPATFPPDSHTHVEAQITDLDKYTQAQVDSKDATVQSNLDNHEANTSNPHAVTAAQVGASPVDHNHDGDYAPLVHTHVEAEITDLDKYTQAEINNFNNQMAAGIFAHQNDKNNPHDTTPAKIGALPLTGGDLTGNLGLTNNADIILAQASAIYATETNGVTSNIILAMDIGDQILVGSTQNNMHLHANQNITAFANLVMSGGTELMLAGDPTQALEAATKQYVDTQLGGSMRFQGQWVPKSYITNDVVTDLGWLMIANKTTEDRAAPQPVGNQYHPVGSSDSSPPWVQLSQFGSILFTGHRYTWPIDQPGYITGYRIWWSQLAALHDVFVITDPEGTPVVDRVLSEWAPGVGGEQWYDFNVNDRLVAGMTFDVVLVTKVQSTTTFDATWNIVNGNGNPASGAIQHQSSNGRVEMRVHHTAAIGGDQQANLESLRAGDTIEIDGFEWEIISRNNDTNFVSLIVNPGVQGDSGQFMCTFTKRNNQNIQYDSIAGGNSGNANIQGIRAVDSYFEADGTVRDDILNQDEYPIDIRVQDAAISPDWDALAYSD